MYLVSYVNCKKTNMYDFIQLSKYRYTSLYIHVQTEVNIYGNDNDDRPTICIQYRVWVASMLRLSIEDLRWIHLRITQTHQRSIIAIKRKVEFPILSWGKYAIVYAKIMICHVSWFLFTSCVFVLIEFLATP